MGVKVAPTCFHLSHPSFPHSPSSSQTLASIILSPYLKRRRFSEGASVFRYTHVQRLDHSALFGIKLSRSRSCDLTKLKTQTIKRACSASFDAFSDEEFSKKIQELAMRFQLSDHDEEDDNENTESTMSEAESDMVTGSVQFQSGSISQDTSLNRATNHKSLFQYMKNRATNLFTLVTRHGDVLIQGQGWRGN